MTSIGDQKIIVWIKDDGKVNIEKIIKKHSTNYIYKGRVEERGKSYYDKEYSETYIVDRRDLDVIDKEFHDLGINIYYRNATKREEWE